VRQLPRKQSPLARDFVASGYYYDKRTGLVQKLTTTPWECWHSIESLRGLG